MSLKPTQDTLKNSAETTTTNQRLRFITKSTRNNNNNPKNFAGYGYGEELVLKLPTTLLFPFS
jgi:hypothetical protein